MATEKGTLSAVPSGLTGYKPERENMNYKIFASESVCAGHPDKICDQISDAILDKALSIHPSSRVAVETLVTTNHVTIAGEVTCPGKINFKKIAKDVIKGLGYTKKSYGFWHNSPITVLVHEQSSDIALGVDTGGAGDQGMMFGYACKETPELMPLPIMLSHNLVRTMDKLSTGRLKYLHPDGKSEVSVVYEDGKPKYVETVVLAKPVSGKVDKDEVKKDLYRCAVIPVLKHYKLPEVPIERVILNGTGKWTNGGPASDTGVTGRKIIVDSYGGMSRIGGGAFSGKDPTKVDRSGAYAARYIAKNIVARGMAVRCEVQLAYVIGYKGPIVKSIETFGTSLVSTKKINDFAWNLIDLSTLGIIKGLKLSRPIYQKTASYGHFGNSSYPWEKIVTGSEVK